MSAERPVESPRSDRLDSWKEIAAFLQRDVRTVQRWEKQAGLPVHRHAESRLRTAYAYRSEVDAWWRSQRVTGEGGADREAAETPLAETRAVERPVTDTLPVPRRRVAAAASVLGAAVLAVLILRLGLSGPPSAPQHQAVPAAAASAATVLLTRFADQGTDPGLAALLEGRVARQLAAHRGIEIIPPLRIARTLRLMKRPADSPITESLGRDLAIRDGGIALLIAGRVHALDSHYFLDIDVVDPSDSRVRLSLEWQGASAQELVSRVTEGAFELGDRLLEAAPAEPVEPLEPVTSSSLAAVRLYTAAVRAGARRQWGASELLARRSIAADGEFASGHAWAGWAMRQQGRRASECLTPLQRAMALSGGTSDRESYFISGALHTVTGEFPLAVAAFEALLRVQPGNRQALDLLIDAYARSGRVNEAADLSLIRAERHPDDFYANVRAAHALTITKRDSARGAALLRRARRLASPQARAERPTWSAWLTLLPTFEHWIAGDRREALEVLVPLERSLADRLGRERDAYSTAVGFAYLAFGQVPEAERAFRHASSPVRQLNLATLALTLDDQKAARRWLLQVREHSSIRPALFARAGLLQEAEQGLRRWRLSEHSAGIDAVTRGLIAARQRPTASALKSLQEGVELLQFTGEPEYFFALDALAREAERRGEVDRAIRLLSDTAAGRVYTYNAGQWTGAHSIRLNKYLAATYRRHGRHQEADRISTSLEKLLPDADHQPAIFGPRKVVPVATSSETR